MILRGRSGAELRFYLNRRFRGGGLRDQRVADHTDIGTDASENNAVISLQTAAEFQASEGGFLDRAISGRERLQLFADVPSPAASDAVRYRKTPAFLRFEIVFRMRVLSEEDIGGRRGCSIFRKKVPDAGQNLRGLPGSESLARS